MSDTSKKSKRNNKFIFAWRDAVMDSDLSRSTKFTLLVISLYMNSKGFNAYPSVETLAKRMSSGVRTVIRSINEATDAGYLSIIKKRKGKDWNHNQYTATFPKNDAKDDNQVDGFLPPEEFAKKLKYFDFPWFLGYLNQDDLNKALPKSELIDYGEETDPDQVPVLDAALYFLEDILFYSMAVERFGDDLDDVWAVHTYRGEPKYCSVRHIQKKIEYIKSNGVRLNLNFKPAINFSADFPYTTIEKIPGRVWPPQADSQVSL